MSLGLNPGDLVDVTIRRARICPTHPDAHGRLTIQYRIADSTWSTLHLVAGAESVTVRPAPLLPPIDPSEQHRKDVAALAARIVDKDREIAWLRDQLTAVQRELQVEIDARDQLLAEAAQRDEQPLRRAS